jgi:hypothetical protein
VVADKDVGCASLYPVAMTNLVRNESQITIDPRPAFDKEVSDNNCSWSEDRWNKKARKEKDHEDRKDQQDPGDIQLTKERPKQKRIGKF